MDQYKKIILDSMTHAASSPLAEQASYQTMLVVRDKLVMKLEDRDLAERVVSRIEFQVSNDIFEDSDFMEAVTEQFANVVLRFYEFAQVEFTSSDRFIDLIANMSLTLVPPQGA